MSGVGVLFRCITVAMCGANLGVMDTGFSLFLEEKFNLDEFQIGLCFVPS